ncbi:MAG: hypothetical protein WAK71_23460, partial [Streptosporangiaceae bacterium]
MYAELGAAHTSKPMPTSFSTDAGRAGYPTEASAEALSRAPEAACSLAAVPAEVSPAPPPEPAAW